MMARTHIVAGAACWIAFAKVGGYPLDVAHVAISAFSSLLPDIDHPNSVVGRRIRPISTIIGGIFGHRGITHSLLAITAFIGILIYFTGQSGTFFSAIAVGYLSHLLADWMTPYGVPLLYPHKQLFSCPVTVKTGSLGEFLILIALVAGMVLFFNYTPLTWHR